MSSPPPADSQDVNMEFSYELKIPKERVAVLIGKSGSVKRELEDLTNTRMVVNSREGDVLIRGDDSLSLYSLKEVVKAIGRGFNPEVARLLLKPDYVLEVIQITDYAKHKNHFARLRGRVIGSDGKSRANIERLTDSFIVVYGKTISVIGSSDGVSLARRAIESLLSGSPHANVYHWLEKARRRLKIQQGGFF